MPCPCPTHGSTMVRDQASWRGWSESSQAGSVGKVMVTKSYLRKWRLDPSRRERGRAERLAWGRDFQAPGAAEAPCPPFLSFHHTPPASLGLPPTSPYPPLFQDQTSSRGNSWVSLIRVREKSESTTASIYSDSSSASYKCQQMTLAVSHFTLSCSGDTAFFYKLKVCGHPALSRSISTVFPTALLFFWYVFIWLRWVLVMACEIQFPDQGSHPGPGCAESQPPDNRGSARKLFKQVRIWFEISMHPGICQGTSYSDFMFFISYF